MRTLIGKLRAAEHEKIELHPNLTLKNITNECRVINLKNDTKMVKGPNPIHTSGINPNSFDLMKISHTDRIINVIKHD
ncbi:hypothetical protein Smp_181310 [Schistosoma mansoni]|uniref:hypothetical protein n=1 Tax=Schistosoma mansoni TaxID=6183 RepID=UPI0001A62ED4|nr:hypothetical protein Smp_181310 [Schistosoma mansoni]|eukprot:XP_018651035.1 hypothetical protein Smp_181310 [Schistosoma mansoni]